MNELRRLALGHHRVPCPECAGLKTRRRDTALSVDVTHDGGAWLCHRCGWRGGWSNTSPRFPIGTTGSAKTGSATKGPRPAPAAPAPQRIALASHWRDLWRSLAPISGTTKEYLLARSCALPPANGDLRCTEKLRHPSGYAGPALVALVTDALTRAPLTLHRTWIRGDGTKADVDPPRMLLGGHRKAGGVIRLWPDEAITGAIAIAEGIESALAVATVYTPVWSTIDAGNMAALPVIDGVAELLIVADHDAAGLKAAKECALRWKQSGRRVRVAIPPQPGTDANDLARRAA